MSIKLFCYCIVIYALQSTQFAAPKPVMTYNNPLLSGLDQIKSGNKNTVSPLKLFSIRLAFLSPKAAIAYLQPLFPSVIFSPHHASQTISFRASNTEQSLIKTALSTIDHPTPQVQMEVQVVEVTVENTSQASGPLSGLITGLDIDYDPSTGIMTTPTLLSSRINAAVINGNANVLAEPRIVSLNNENAKLKIGDRIPYTTIILKDKVHSEQVHYIDTGIHLNLTPRVVSGNQIEMEIESDVISVKLWKVFDKSQYPVLARRHTESTIRLKENELFVMAGLLDEREEDKRIGLPILMDIPIIGGLFSSTEHQLHKSDIIFMLRVSLIDKS